MFVYFAKSLILCSRMPKNQSNVYLGYEDEIVVETNQSLLNYTVNKIGGLPDWPPLQNLQFISKCPLCGLHRLLIVQCYAPLENSPYHRTLYVFACISPNCWIQSDGWICVRSQFLNKSNVSGTVVALPKVDTNVAWCEGADEWDDTEDTANGNVMNIDNVPSPNNGVQRNSDEDDESNSFEVDTVEQALGNLQMYDAHNANMSPIQGAVGAIGVPVAAAELEGGDETDLVTIDTPTMAVNDIQTLLLQTAELPHDLRTRLMCGPLQFVPKFVYVEKEWKTSAIENDNDLNELYNINYKNENEIDVCGGAEGAGGGVEDEPYEEDTPSHGDKLFHAFLTRIKRNPGQILRYSRERPPILGAPLPGSAGTPEVPDAGVPTVCARCDAALICELQLVPPLVDALQLPSYSQISHLHFLSVLIFTCSKSCWQSSDTLVKETVIFQPEVV